MTPAFIIIGQIFVYTGGAIGLLLLLACAAGVIVGAVRAWRGGAEWAGAKVMASGSGMPREERQRLVKRMQYAAQRAGFKPTHQYYRMLAHLARLSRK